jgi:hypothetical protein
MAAAGLQSWIQAPLGNPEDPAGYLSVRSTVQNAYTESDLTRLVRVAGLISPAFEIARLYAQSR